MLFLALSGCATAPKPLSYTESKEQLFRLFIGEFRSKATPISTADSREIVMTVREVSRPQADSALFVELRYNDASKSLYRQRLYVFSPLPDKSGLSMQALAFKDPNAAAALLREPSYLLEHPLESFDSLGAGCEMRWQRTAEAWTGSISPETCLISGKRGDRRRIEAITILREDSIGLLERGFDESGKLLFGNETAQFNWWPRTVARNQ